MSEKFWKPIELPCESDGDEEVAIECINPKSLTKLPPVTANRGYQVPKPLLVETAALMVGLTWMNEINNKIY